MAADLYAAGNGRSQDGRGRSGLGLIRRVAFWPVFAALVAVFVYGFWSSGVIRQNMWTALGLARLQWFLAVYAAWTAAGLALFPRWFTRATAALALAYTVAVAGPRAPAAVAFFLSSSWVLGLLLGVDGLLATVLGMSVYALIVGFIVHLPVNYPVLYAGLLALPWIFGWRRAWTAARRRLTWQQCDNRRQALAAALLAVTLIMHLLVALGPEASADGLAVHLAVPESVIAHHQWAFDVRHTTWAAMPLNADWAFTAAYALGGEAAARLFNYGTLLMVTAILYGLLRRTLPPSVSMMLGALFVSSPIVQLVTGSLFVENFWAALTIGAFLALVSYRDAGSVKFARAAAVLCGAGLATKFGAFVFLAPFVALLAIELRCNRALRLAPALLLCIAIFGAPPYVGAYLKTGNPVFPFMNNLFRSPDFEQKSFTDGRFQKPLAAGALYDLTFRTSQHFEGQNGGWAFQFLVLLPLAALLMSRRWDYAPWAALVISLTFAILTLVPQSNVRYLYPALPLFTLGIGGMVAALRNMSATAYRAVVSSAVVFAALNLYFLPASGWSHQDFFVNSLFDPTDRSRYLEAVAPRRNLIDYLNRTHPGEPALFVENSQIAGLFGKAYTTTWHTYAFAQGLLSTRNALDCLKFLNKSRLRYILAPADPGQVTYAPLRQVINEFTIPEHASGDWAVRRVRRDFEGGNLPQTLRLMSEGRWKVGAGDYDDTNPRIGFTGRWITDRQFAQAANGTITYSNHPGDLFRLTFSGSRITWIYTKAFNRGRADVVIDGVLNSTVDLYASDTQWQQRTSFDRLGPGQHVMEVRVTGRQDPAATACWVDVDALIVE